MIRHVVLWRLADEPRRDASLVDMTRLQLSVATMQAKVPGLLRGGYCARKGRGRRCSRPGVLL